MIMASHPIQAVAHHPDGRPDERHHDPAVVAPVGDRHSVWLSASAPAL